MLIVDSLIVSGVRFVLERLAEAVYAELYDETSLREELLAAQMKLELGEISEDEFAQIERQVLSAMREVRVRREGTSPTSFELLERERAPEPRRSREAGRDGSSGDGEADAPRLRLTFEGVEADLGQDEGDGGLASKPP